MKVITISGGSSGLGLEIAKILSPSNQVIILSTRNGRYGEAAKEAKCDYHFCDVKRSESVEKAIDYIIEKYHRIDCLINNAGIWIEGPIEENEAAGIEQVMQVNAIGTILLTQAVVPQMKVQKSGDIINIISLGGLHGKANRSVYTASKFAITGFTRSLQSELAKDGIRVTGIFPGKMDTPMFEKVEVDKDMSDALDPREVAHLVAFLLKLPPKVTIPEVLIKHLDN